MIWWLLLFACSTESSPSKTTPPPPKVEQPPPELSSSPELKVERSSKTGPQKRFLLKDGSVITGMFLGTNSEGFEVQTESLGRISIPADNVITMSSLEADPPTTTQNKNKKDIVDDTVPTLNNNNIHTIPVLQGEHSISNIPIPNTPMASTQQLHPGMIQNIQDSMMRDPSILEALYSLQNDPEMMRLLQDPELLMLIQKGDVKALQKHPSIKKLENNPQLKYIFKQLQ